MIGGVLDVVSGPARHSPPPPDLQPSSQVAPTVVSSYTNSRNNWETQAVQGKHQSLGFELGPVWLGYR